MIDPHYSLTRTSTPAEPVTLTELKAYCWIPASFTADDTLLESFGKEAREAIEELNGVQLVTATYVLRLDGYGGFPDELILRPYPVQAVTGITYLDEAAASQALASSVYSLDGYSKPARLSLAYNQSWPTVLPQQGAIAITFTAGYGAAADVPERFKLKIKQAAKFRYTHRDVVDEDWLEKFLARHRSGWLF